MDFKETIFITGFPGFIAGKLVKRLANSWTEFLLLVQPQFVEKAMKDVEKIAQETNTPLGNFCIVQGDITEDALGMSQEDLHFAQENVTSIFHLAAIYDLAVKKEIAYKVNVDGTKNVNAFAKSLTKLKRYNYVSTCYVAGKRTGKILETELEHDKGFHNFYEETKYFAEVEVEKLKGELPITIYRPAVVVGDSKTGETAKYDGVYYVINYLKTFPSLLRLVNTGNKVGSINLVPVDYVVEGLYQLSKDERAIGKTVALADSITMKTADICDEIAYSLCKRKSIVNLPPSLMQKILMLPFSPMVSGLPHAGVPYFFNPQDFDTKIGENLMKLYGVSCPHFSEYVGNLIKFVKQNPKL
ncbi:MAG: SDR family oxidoreductase [Pyrinomonadaceae bacterium]|jgi:thioester reductase-like protein|nr:SDR family oxidoreductase [Pyrinomonadaceae bacterium]